MVLFEDHEDVGVVWHHECFEFGLHAICYLLASLTQGIVLYRLVLLYQFRSCNTGSALGGGIPIVYDNAIDSHKYPKG